jgi:hypothetical protein
MSSATGDFQALFNMINSKSIELPHELLHDGESAQNDPCANVHHVGTQECTCFMEKAR